MSFNKEGNKIEKQKPRSKNLQTNASFQYLHRKRKKEGMTQRREKPSQGEND